MAWFKMDDGFANSKPVLRIPRRYRLQAVGLWALAGTWSAKEETDGFIPEYVLEELCGTPGVANQLVQAGLWQVVPASSGDPTSILSPSSGDSVGILSTSSSDPHLGKVSARTDVEAELGPVWEAGYRYGTTHKEPLNAAALRVQSPTREESDAGSPAKKNTDAATERPNN